METCRPDATTVAPLEILDPAIGRKHRPVSVGEIERPALSQPASPVTVVIAVWDDYVAFLTEAVESVRRSSPGEVPIVVIDNASTPPVPELSGTRVVRAPTRLSVGAARSLGIAQVETEYVIVLDADDLILEGTLDFLAGRMEGDDQLAACATALLEEDTNSRHRTPRWFVPRLTGFRRVFALANCVWSLYPIQGCTIMRTAQVKAAGAYPDAGWGDDWVLAVSLAFRGRVEAHRRFGLLYRHTQDSLWRTPKSSAELANSARLVRERLRSDPDVPAYARVLLPLIFVLQLAAVYLLRPVYRATRSRLRFGA